MTIKRKPQGKALGINEPLRHADHPRPKTRREFIQQGFMSGSGMLLSSSALGLMGNPLSALAASNLSADLQQIAADTGCEIGGLTGTPAIPFICFDLAGGANFAGSNVVVGTNSQIAPLSTSGYNKMGLPGDIIPGLSDTLLAATMLTPTGSDGEFRNTQLGLKFHSDSAMLAGILEKFTSLPSLPANAVDGAVIAARSDNDTGNNTHNPMYGIAQAGAAGGVVSLIGSRNSESGGNSMAPPGLIIPELRPTKVDRPSDVTGMVDVGNLTDVFPSADVTAVMESMTRISHEKLKLSNVTPGISTADDQAIKELVRCGYLKAADIAERFADLEVNPATDPVIVGGASSIFTSTEFNNDGEFRKTASVMKMVLDRHAGAGCITMGGYDYHTGDRSTGEIRDRRAGRCIGACLEYAAQVGQPLMIYVFSDGSVASNGSLDNSTEGRGKGVWTGDNSSTACAFFLVFNPNGGITAMHVDPNDVTQPQRQIGNYSASGSVATSSSPAANNVNLLVNTVIANYMSLSNDMTFATKFSNHGLGDYSQYVMFEPLV